MSTDSNQNVWYFLIGAGFLGFWLGMGIFNVAEDGWFVWGLLGIAVAAAFYAGRLGNDNVRYAIWIAIGLALGILTVAAFVEGEEMFIATFVTGAGAGLIAAGLPPHAQAAPRQQDPRMAPPVRPDAHDQPPAPARPHQPGYGQQQQWHPSGQQQQQSSRVYGDEYR